MSTDTPTYGESAAGVSDGPPRVRAELRHPGARAAFGCVKRLVAAYLALSVASLVAIALLRHDHAAVNSAVWTHGAIVALSALLTFFLTVRAARGSARAFLRLRIISVVMVVAIAVIIALPGSFPLWMKVEHGACGILLIAVAAIVNGRELRAVFATR